MRVAIVTGAAQGIGLAVARRLGADGCSVVVADLALERATSAAQGLQADGIDARPARVDVSDAADCEELVQSVVSDCGRVDALVNCANIAVYGASEMMPEREWRAQIDVGLTGLFFATQAVARVMLAGDGGAIVNIASIGGMGGWPLRAAYNASKAGVINLTETLATEWAHRGVRVNAISPGVTRTEMTQHAFREGVASEGRYVGRTPLGRLAAPEEMASVVAFLLSDRASGITGVNVRVDGGWVAWANPHGEGFPA
jgi:3-oxoacyl-[acyl-carrier protein] reductase